MKASVPNSLLLVIASGCGRVDFDAASFDLEITIVGTGSGTVRDGDALECESGTCLQAYPLGATVELAVTLNRAALIGFSGDCSGTSCIVTMGGPRRVTVELGAYNLVFVTSTTMTPTELVARGDGSAVVGGERVCAERATAAGLTGTFVPWISDAATHAGDQLAGARGWVRLDGAPFADSPESLLQQLQTFYPILFDELGNDPEPRFTMSATTGDGQFSAGYSCTSWTSTTTSVLVGNASWGTGGWAGSYQGACTVAHPFVCFQIDHAQPLVLTPATGRIAFRSAPWAPGGGLASADAKCMAEAAAAGYTGMFRALLATDTASAISRMDLGGLPWVRSDGVRLVLTADDLAAGKLVTSLTASADRQTYGGEYAWTGAVGLTSPSPGRSCSNWTSTTASSRAHVGEAFRTRVDWFAQNYDEPCDSAQYLYCLEQ